MIALVAEVTGLSHDDVMERFTMEQVALKFYFKLKREIAKEERSAKLTAVYLAKVLGLTT